MATVPDDDAESGYDFPLTERQRARLEEYFTEVTDSGVQHFITWMAERGRRVEPGSRIVEDARRRIIADMRPKIEKAWRRGIIRSQLGALAVMEAEDVVWLAGGRAEAEGKPELGRARINAFLDQVEARRADFRAKFAAEIQAKIDGPPTNKLHLHPLSEASRCPAVQELNRRHGSADR